MHHQTSVNVLHEEVVVTVAVSAGPVGEDSERTIGSSGGRAAAERLFLFFSIAIGNATHILR